VIDDFSEFTHGTDQCFYLRFTSSYLTEVIVTKIIIRGFGDDATKAHLK